MRTLDSDRRRGRGVLASAGGSTLGSNVDVWEIGNEINGEWVCAKNASKCTSAQTQAVVDRIQGAYDVVRQSGGKTALTLYFNDGCWASPENEMFTWAQKNVPQALKQGLDYVYVSYYEDDCNGLQPDWNAVFSKLATMFPNSYVGFGECGTTQSSRKAAYVKRYYSTTINDPRYVGGYFWWYFAEDMVPRTQPLWGVLNNTIAAQ